LIKIYENKVKKNI
jgi:hypothetical protein